MSHGFMLFRLKGPLPGGSAPLGQLVESLTLPFGPLEEVTRRLLALPGMQRLSPETEVSAEAEAILEEVKKKLLPQKIPPHVELCWASHPRELNVVIWADPVVNISSERSSPWDFLRIVDAAMLVEEPLSREWGHTARDAAPDLWRKAVLAVALDPSRSFDERGVVLALGFSEPDPDLARGLAPLLDDTGARGLAEIAADVILGALGGGEGQVREDGGPSLITGARAALGKLDAESVVPD